LAAALEFKPVIKTGSPPEQYSVVVVVMVSDPEKSFTLKVNDAELEHPLALLATTPMTSPSWSV
jgi:hypothetical protein